MSLLRQNVASHNIIVSKQKSFKCNSSKTLTSQNVAATPADDHIASAAVAAPPVADVPVAAAPPLLAASVEAFPEAAASVEAAPVAAPPVTAAPPLFAASVAAFPVAAASVAGARGCSSLVCCSYWLPKTLAATPSVTVTM
jgi:hypothetical protein